MPRMIVIPQLWSMSDGHWLYYWRLPKCMFMRSAEDWVEYFLGRLQPDAASAAASAAEASSSVPMWLHLAEYPPRLRLYEFVSQCVRGRARRRDCAGMPASVHCAVPLLTHRISPHQRSHPHCGAAAQRRCVHPRRPRTALCPRSYGTRSGEMDSPAGHCSTQTRGGASHARPRQQ